MRPSVIAVLILFCSPTLTAIQSEPEPASTDVEITVTASAIEEPVDEVPVSVEVIGREEIERNHATDVADLLRSVPGVIVARSGTIGKQASLFMRGSNSTQTLVLWDGIEINDPYFSGYDWGRFPTEGIERIEVVRGPFSSLYGADAIGGVINVVPREPVDEIFGSLSAGEHAYGHLRAGVNSISDRIATLLVVETRTDDGFSDNDDLEQIAITGTLDFEPTDTFTAGVKVRFDDHDLGIPFNLGLASPRRRQTGQQWQLAIPVDGRVGPAEWNLTVSRTENELTFDDPEGAFGPESGITNSVTNRLQASVQLPGSFGTTIFGAEREEAKVDDESFGFTNLASETRDVTAAFLEHRFTTTFDRIRFDLIGGIRHDDYDQFGSVTSPRLSASGTIGPHRFRAAWGEAFRAPSVGDLYYPFYGNPDLEDETMTGYEIGYDFDTGRGTFGLTWFDNDYENLIVFDNAAGRAGNIGLAHSNGLEISVRHRLRDALMAGVSWTWLETEDEIAARELLRRPEQSGSLDLAWTPGSWSASLSTVYNGDRLDVEAGFPFGIVPSEDWMRTDLAVGRVIGSFTPWLRVENIFDEVYTEVLGFPAPARRVIIGVRYSRKGNL